MRVYVERTFGTWDEDEQAEKHRVNFTPQTYKIILVEEAEAGLVAVEHLADHIWLVKLYLLADFRNCGIGSEVLRHVTRDADEDRKPVRLRVLRVNTQAQALYRRHGFRVIEESPERLFMERAATNT